MYAAFQPASASSDVVCPQSLQTSTSAAAVQITITSGVSVVNNLSGTGATIVVHDDHACQPVSPSSDVTQSQSRQANTSSAPELPATCAEDVGLPVTPGILGPGVSGTAENSISCTRVHVIDISPMPSAPARSGTNNRNKAFQTSCILTSTPHKTLVRDKSNKKPGLKQLSYNRDEEEAHSSNKTKGKQYMRANKEQKPIQQVPQKRKGRNITTEQGSKKKRVESSTDDTPCCVCHKRFNEPPRDSWTQCPECSQWYHDSCGPGDTTYCYFCLD